MKNEPRESGDGHPGPAAQSRISRDGPKRAGHKLLNFIRRRAVPFHNTKRELGTE